MLSIFWKSKYRNFVFILKSGVKIHFRCTDLKWEYNTATLAIISYSIEGLDEKHNIPRHVIPSEIAAIVRVP
jgi:hypothetical protein